MHSRLPSVLLPPLVGLEHGVEDEGEDGDGDRQEYQEQENAAQVDHHEHVDIETHHVHIVHGGLRVVHIQIHIDRHSNYMAFQFTPLSLMAAMLLNSPENDVLAGLNSSRGHY